MKNVKKNGSLAVQNKFVLLTEKQWPKTSFIHFIHLALISTSIIKGSNFGKVRVTLIYIIIVEAFRTPYFMIVGKRLVIYGDPSFIESLATSVSCWFSFL